MAISFQTLPPKDAIEFFKSKGYAIGFNWQDIFKEENARAFTVAKVMRYDLLEDIRRAVYLAIAEGHTLHRFKKELIPTLKAKGWWEKGMVFDPKTEKLVMSQLGSHRRLEIIYDTNLRMARAAGQWKRITAVKKNRPYLTYVIVGDERTRPHHRTKNMWTFPVDHPFWDEWYPPNGWHCRCSVRQHSLRDLKRLDIKVTSENAFNNIIKKPATNFRTGEIQQLPVGISKGFNYNVGKHHMRGITPPPSSNPIKTPSSNPIKTPSSNPIKTPSSNPIKTPSSNPIKTPTIINDNPPPMPPARTVEASRLTDPIGKTDDQLIDMFIAEFEGEIILKDKIGEPILISKDFFFDFRTGRHKLDQKLRKKAILLFADTIKNPDEIWWSWEYHEFEQRYKLIRRYFAQFNVEGIAAPIMIAFETSKDGWKGLTAFRPRKVDYLKKQRGGVLAYRKPEKDEQ